MLHIIIIISIILLLLMFHSLIQQSKNPSGFLGKRMMKLWNWTYLPMFVWAIRYLDRTSYPAILDVGVGNGRSTILLKETFPQSTVTGIDISDTAIAQAKQIGMVNLNFERRDVRETGFSDESFDFSFSNAFSLARSRGFFYRASKDTQIRRDALTSL